MASANQSQLFKTFGKQKVGGHSQLKHSVQRSIRSQIADQFPWLVDNDVLDALLPKKADLTLIKLPEHVQLLVQDGEALFFSTRDGGWFPTSRLLHKYPLMMPRLRVDKGAIKFVMSGANIMCPGLTSEGATIHDAVDKETPVAIFAEGKEHAVAVGFTTMSTEDMVALNKGIGVDVLHVLNDGLWKMASI